MVLATCRSTRGLPSLIPTSTARADADDKAPVRPGTSLPDAAPGLAGTRPCSAALMCSCTSEGLAPGTRSFSPPAGMASAPSRAADRSAPCPGIQGEPGGRLSGLATRRCAKGRPGSCVVALRSSARAPLEGAEPVRPREVAAKAAEEQGAGKGTWESLLLSIWLTTLLRCAPMSTPASAPTAWSPGSASSSPGSRAKGPGATGVCRCSAASRSPSCQRMASEKRPLVAFAAPRALLSRARRAGAASATGPTSLAHSGDALASDDTAPPPACGDTAPAVTPGCPRRSSPTRPGSSLSPAPSRPLPTTPIPLSAPAREGWMSQKQPPL